MGAGSRAYRQSKASLKYTDLTELTAPLLNELIEKIVVHEGVRDDSGNRTQEVDIYYRFVGMID